MRVCEATFCMHAVLKSRIALRNVGVCMQGSVHRFSSFANHLTLLCCYFMQC